jgi:hypothetical protein
VRFRARLFIPLVQVILSLAGMYGGASLVDFAHAGVLGFTVLFTFLALFLDGLFRNPTVPNDPRSLTTHEEILDRYRHAK